MRKVTLNTMCGLRHPFNKGRRNDCKAIQAGISNACSPLIGINPNLFEACVNRVQTKPSLTKEEFLCKELGGQVLLENFGIEACGFTLEESPQSKSFNQIIKFAFFAFAATALVVVPIFLIFRK